jgi:hypothetical protein
LISTAEILNFIALFIDFSPFRGIIIYHQKVLYGKCQFEFFPNFEFNVIFIGMRIWLVITQAFTAEQEAENEFE